MFLEKIETKTSMPPRHRKLSFTTILTTQVIVIAAFGMAFARSSQHEGGLRRGGNPLAGRGATADVPIAREAPLRVPGLYDAPELVSDAELAAVLKQVRPKFKQNHLKPNYVEHALRIWGVDATFADPEVMSGVQMQEFLTDHAKYLASWGEKIDPLLMENEAGVSIRWGKSEGASVHHDHWLACLTEAGIRLDEPVFVPSHRQKSIRDVLQQSLRDFRVDERETEWSALAFGLWLPPVRSWQTNDGRELSFDLLARRLLRGLKSQGVCHGTHRLYSMMLLVRLDDEFHILSPEIRGDILAHLGRIRDILKESQFADGHWPSNWPDGAAAVKAPIEDEQFRQVIATGHHLEWLAIAPEELHPPREQIHKAARWLIKTTTEQSEQAILEKYTFYSHVGGALALWRQTRPADFWRTWEAAHPEPAK